MVGLVLGVIALAATWYGYAYAVSPEAIRHPKQGHYHFRLQILNGGNLVNFADDKFQTPYDKDICTAELTKQPVHFHDNKDQFVHIHWDGITGGVVLKHYGWNFLAGTDGTLGYKFNGLREPQRVGVHGQNLPAPPKDSKYYVYTGDEQGFKERDWNDFLKQDLRKFLAGQQASSLADWLIPAAYAHGGVDDGDDEQTLARLNSLVGNVVIFVQKDKPADEEVRERFLRLESLPESSCAG